MNGHVKVPGTKVSRGWLSRVRVWIIEPVVSTGELIEKQPGVVVHARNPSILLARTGEHRV